MSEPMPLSSFKRLCTRIMTLPTGMVLALLVPSSALARQTRFRGGARLHIGAG